MLAARYASRASQAPPCSSTKDFESRRPSTAGVALVRISRIAFLFHHCVAIPAGCGYRKIICALTVL
jgi:hypothetical protein